MRILRRIVGCTVFGAILAASAMPMHAQDTTKKKPTKEAPAHEKAAPAQQHTAPPVQQSTPPAVQPHNVPTPAQTHTPSTPPPVNQAPQHPTPQTHVQPATPSQTAPAHQPQPAYTPSNRNTQPASGAQPGRSFGANPPGRTPAAVGGSPMATPARTVTTSKGDVIHRDSSGQVRQVRGRVCPEQRLADRQAGSETE